MADQHLMTITYAGRDLIVPHFTEGVEGKVGDIIFSRVVAGDDILPEDQNLRELTEIQNPKLEMPVVSCEIKEYNGERAAYLDAALQSVTLEEGFRVRVIGIYARDPYTDMEILYAVSHFPQITTETMDENGVTTVTIEETGEWMPAIDSGKIVDVLYSIITVIGQAENVICNIVDDIIHVTIKEFRDHLDDRNPHPNQPHLDGTKTKADYLLGKNSGDNNFYQISLGDIINQLLADTTGSIKISGDAKGAVTVQSDGKTDINLTDIIATRLKYPRTITVAGKGRGSAEFDGTRNITINLSSVDADTLGGKTLEYILGQIGAIEVTVAGMGDGLPIGAILPYAGAIENIPAGWHLCDGKNGTPDLRDLFLMGWGSNAAGKKIAAGLPNIKGQLKGADKNERISLCDNWKNSGALSVAEIAKTPEGWIGDAEAGGAGTNVINFDASKGTYNSAGKKVDQANSVYGKSNTVQPPAYVVYYIMKTGA